VAFERWGSLSVDDHADTEALAANILLYDRLVVPVMTEQADRDERAYWVSQGWSPELQAERVEQLGALAVRRPWDQFRRRAYRTRVEELRAEQFDASGIDHKQITRMILAQEEVMDKPPGVTAVTVVAAYNSLVGLNRDFPVHTTSDHLSAQAYLLSRRLAVPNLPGDTLISRCVTLSQDEDFRQRRSDLFDWQEAAVAKGWSPHETVARIGEMTDRYNAKVIQASGEVRWKFAFTISGIALGFATGGPIGASAAAALSLIQFVALDRKPNIEAGSSQPAAMLHDVESRLGITLLS
jgi:hypothetical protein